MRFARFLLPIASFLLLVFPAHALTDAWTVDVRQHGAVQRTYKQGETHDLTVTLRDGLKPLDLTGATAHFYWYTNATDNLWWTNAAAVSPSGLVTASWTPDMDTGAASYNWWIGIWQAGATSPLWRVTGTIRMLPSPGFTPNALPLPARTLDFSAVALTNAPWATTNALAGALQSASATNALFAAWFGSLFNSTSRWDAAYDWGDWHAAVASNAVAIGVLQTGKLDVAASLSFLTSEADLAALRTYHYGSPEIVESPTNWFTFDGAGTITGINSASVTNWNIVIPWQIGSSVVTIIGDSALTELSALTSLTMPKNVTTWGMAAVTYCDKLTAIYYSGNAPAIGPMLFYNSPAVTNYVTNPTATGWGSTYEERPVVRLPLHTDSLSLGGVTRTSWPTTDVSGLAPTQSVAAVAGDIGAVATIQNNHTANGTIGSDGHASSVEKANWNGKLSASGGTASNLTATGWIALPQSQPTNLIMRLVSSNDVIMAIGVIQ